MVRPSYVLGGRAMEIVADGNEIDRYLARLAVTLDQPSELAVSDKRPLLIDRYPRPTPSRSTSTAFATARTRSIAGILEHIEEAGIHSGDSACSLPAPTRSPPRSSCASRSRRETWRWRSTWWA